LRPTDPTSFSNTNLTSDQVDLAIANDLSRRMDGGAQIPVGGRRTDPATFSVTVDGREIEYRTVINPSSSTAKVSTYFLTR
jgi:hypothetical protein